MADLDTTRFGLIIDWLLENLPNVVDFQVSEGWDDTGADSIMIGKTTIVQDWQALGARSRNEDTVTDILIYSSIEGGTATEVRKRAITAANQVGRVLRTDTTAISLGGLCAWSSLRAVEWIPGMLPDGRDGFLHLELATFNTRF